MPPHAKKAVFLGAKGPVRGSSSCMLGFTGVKQVGALCVCVKERALMSEPEHTEMCGHLATRS